MLYKPDVGQGMSQQNVFHGQIIAFSCCKNTKYYHGMQKC